MMINLMKSLTEYNEQELNWNQSFQFYGSCVQEPKPFWQTTDNIIHYN